MSKFLVTSGTFDRLGPMDSLCRMETAFLELDKESLLTYETYECGP